MKKTVIYELHILALSKGWAFLCNLFFVPIHCLNLGYYFVFWEVTVTFAWTVSCKFKDFFHVKEMNFSNPLCLISLSVPCVSWDPCAQPSLLKSSYGNPLLKVWWIGGQFRVTWKQRDLLPVLHVFSWFVSASGKIQGHTPTA